MLILKIDKYDEDLMLVSCYCSIKHYSKMGLSINNAMFVGEEVLGLYDGSMSMLRH
jgi:hypothetical protein